MNGSKKMIYRVSTLCLLLLFTVPNIFAEERIEQDILPSMSFLEFIGEWETEDGEWIDPLDMENEETGKLIEVISGQNDNDTDNEN